MDDKCDSCGSWTQEAFTRYQGHYNDGSQIDHICTCNPNPDDNTEALLWDLGALPSKHPFSTASPNLAQLASLDQHEATKP